MARERPARTARLDQPREARRALFTKPQVDPDTFGRFAEKFARYMGTARFLVYMTIFVAVWVTVNVIGIFGYKWDIWDLRLQVGHIPVHLPHAPAQSAGVVCRAVDPAGPEPTNRP